MQYIQNVMEKIKALFRGGFFHIFFGNTLVKMISFISSIVIVRLVNKQEYAYLTYADNLYSYVTAFSGLGMTSAILKYCAATKTKEEDKSYFNFAMKYGTLFQTVLVIVVIAYVTFLEIPFPNAKEIVYILCLYPIMTNILSTILSYCRAHANNQLYAKLSIVQTAVVFAGSVGLVLIMGINGIAVARYIAIGAAIIMAFRYLKSMLKGVESKKLTSGEIRGFMVMSVSLMISSLFSLIMPMNEMTIINEVIRNEIVTANYKVAIMIPSQLAFVSHSIVIYYFTIIAKMTDKKEIWKLAKKVGIVTSAVIGVITAIGIVLGPYIIRFVYGNKYEDAVVLSNVFWIVNAINSALRVVPMNFLPAIGVAKFNAIVSGVSCVVHVLITYCAISLWGIWGAGIATALVYLGSAIVYWGYFRKKCLA